MKLSLIIPFCDKDYNYIPSLINNIEHDIRINHEIILLDNRDKKRNCLIDTQGVPIHSLNGNQFTFEARRRAIDFVTGDYMWFIDADDNVLPLKDEDYFKDYKDYYSHKSVSIISNFENKKELIINQSFGHSFNDSLWQVIIKTDFWIKIIHHIPPNVKLISGEDVFISNLCKKYAKSWGKTNKVLYIYNQYLGYCGSNKKNYYSADWFKNMFPNMKLLYNLYKKNFTDEDFTNLGIPKGYPFDKRSLDYMQYILSSVLDTDKNECIEWVKNEYGIDLKTN